MKQIVKCSRCKVYLWESSQIVCRSCLIDWKKNVIIGVVREVKE